MTLTAADINDAEPEVTEPTELVVHGRLNPLAVGWMRQPLIDTGGLGTISGMGRNKRWEYWNVVTPTHIVALTISSIDYAGIHEVWVLDRRTEETWSAAKTDILKPVRMPANLEDSSLRIVTGELAIAIDPTAAGTRLRARIPGASFDITAHLPQSHERLGVVVPWSHKRFQYTVKDIARPATGWIETGGIRERVPVGESWATLDHGRGRWPYDIEWNWGAAAGTVEHAGESHTLGIQIGDKWTDGTGMTENSVYFDGLITKVGSLEWNYDIANWWRPWTVNGEGMELVFSPFYNKQSRTDLKVLSSRTDQCFGTYRGTVTVDGVGSVEFDGLVGWAEEVHNCW